MNKSGIMLRYNCMVTVLLLFSVCAGCVAHVGEQDNGYFFSFDSALITPSVVPRGGELTVEWIYTIRNVPQGRIKPREKIAIFKGNKLLAVLQEKYFRVEDGTWQDYLTFELPRRLSVGSYTIVITLSDGSSVYTKKNIFTIR